VESPEVILLDTNALIWFSGSAGFGKRSQTIANQALAEGQLAVSSISFWEVALLATKGRLRALIPATQFRDEVLGTGTIELPLNSEIAIRAVDLGNLPADPADRFIVATALVHNAILMTADERLLEWRHTLKRQDARH
jgi:PIN domain nuclease of toxin-antitoxin system